MREFVGIVGSRDYAPLMAIETLIDRLPADVVVVTGTWPDLRPSGLARDRVDERAARHAYSRRLAVIVHPALWHGARGDTAYHKWAGKARNTLIVRDITRLVAFWDGKSEGTRDAIDKAEARRIPVTTIAPWAPLPDMSIIMRQ